MLQDPWVMVAEKGNERSGLAMSALVRGMANKKQVAIILFVPRVSETGGANAATCVAYPLLVRTCHLNFEDSSCSIWPSIYCESGRVLACVFSTREFGLQGNSQQPDCLILNHLPFAEDLRVARFASLDEKPDLIPSLSQLDQMRRVVQDLELSTGLSWLFGFLFSESGVKKH